MYITEYIFGGQNTHFSLVYTQVELLDYKILTIDTSNFFKKKGTSVLQLAMHEGLSQQFKKWNMGFSVCLASAAEARQ